MKNNKKETKNINDEVKRLRHLIGVQRAQFKDDLEGHEALIKGLKKEIQYLKAFNKFLINRNIFQVEVHEQPIEEERIEKLRHSIAEKMDIDIADTDYFISWSEVQKDMYDVEDDSIDILYKDGSVKDISEASELLNVQLLSKKIRKYYLCYQRI